ncbi:PPPDE putative thiol peptidase family protein [Forsythia ovata]|uniref:PPPDE putative thiol peptidase family protein n=1 Tax=Forsythia ovata TaxID=205694 RepID=A0ABD1RLA8_9LAMI
MIQRLEATLRIGAVPQAPQTKNEDVERESKREPSNCGRQQEKKDVSPACGAQEKTSNNGLLVDPLGDARNKVQEEISSEFSALMATGTIRASEAAALATKRVMQRYGHMNAAQS